MADSVATLELLSGPRAGTRFRLAGGSAVIGRSSDADIPLPEVRGVSRRHTEVELRNGTVLVRDLGSQNGTFLDDEQIQESEAADGAVIRLGQCSFRLHLEASGQLPAQGGRNGSLATAPGGGLTEPAASPGAAAQSVGEEQTTSRSFLWASLLAILLIGTGLYALHTYYDAGAEPRRESFILKREAQRVVMLPRVAEGFTSLRVRGEEEGWEPVRWGRFHGLINSEVTSRIVILEGKNSGAGVVEVLRNGEVVYSFDVYVRGRVEPKLPEPVTKQDALRLAEKKMDEGEALLADQPYAAMKSYEAAAEYFGLGRDLRRRSEADRRARRIETELSDRVTELYERAYYEIKPASDLEEPDYLAGMELLMEIKRLIRDPDSVDWQLAHKVQQIAKKALRRQRGIQAP